MVIFMIVDISAGEGLGHKQSGFLVIIQNEYMVHLHFQRLQISIFPRQNLSLIYLLFVMNHRGEENEHQREYR